MPGLIWISEPSFPLGNKRPFENFIVVEAVKVGDRKSWRRLAVKLLNQVHAGQGRIQSNQPLKIGCQVLDISQQGAKVVVRTPSAVPDRFELAFFQGGQSRVCEVIWRRSKMLGVRFIF
jgi:hypothetical protein